MLLSCSTRLFGQVAPPIWPSDLQCGCAFIDKKYAESDNDASNSDDVEALLSYVLNCTPCHSDGYSFRFFSCRPRYWNKSGSMFLKFHCDIKQFHRNIKQFHYSIKEIENTTMEFYRSIKEMENATMEFHRSIKKAPFCPLCGVFCWTYPIHVLTCRYTTWSAEKKICLMMFQILKLGNWIFRLFKDSHIICYKNYLKNGKLKE